MESFPIFISYKIIPTKEATRIKLTANLKNLKLNSCSNFHLVQNNIHEGSKLAVNLKILNSTLGIILQFSFRIRYPRRKQHETHCQSKNLKYKLNLWNPPIFISYKIISPKKAARNSQSKNLKLVESSSNLHLVIK